MTDRSEGSPEARPPSAGGIAAALLAAAITIVAGAWSLALPRAIGWGLYPQQVFAMVLALTLATAFLTLPAKRKTVRAAIPRYDVVLALVGFVAAAWIAVRYPDLVNKIFFRPRPAEIWVPGLIVILLMIEALRRATGWALVAIVVVFILYGLFGDALPGRFAGKAQDWQKFAGYVAFDSNGILGIPMAVASTIVVAFIFFGAALQATGGSRFFTDAALISMGRYRGGSMKIAVVASGLFGSISGSAVANVVATGVVTIPMIKRTGYPAAKAGAIEAVASTGGQLMPPVMGAAAFLMAEYLQVPYAEVVFAALVPGLLYYAALFIQADLEAGRLGISRVDPKDIPAARLVAGGLYFAFAFALLIYALFGMNWQPERAALAAGAVVIVSGLLFGYRGERPRLTALAATLVVTGFGVIEIILISAAAGIVIAVLNVTGLGFNLTYMLVSLGEGSAFLLLSLSAVVCIILGMGLPTLGVYVLLATLVAPALVEVGITPMAAHLYVLYFGMMSMITPPVAIAAFAAAAIAGADPMRTGFEAMRFGWTAYVVPVLFVTSPSLLLIGDAFHVGQAVLTAFMGVWLVAIAMAGFFVRRLTVPMRLAFALAGIAALVPAGAFALAIWTDITGAILGGLLIAREIVANRRAGEAMKPTPAS